MLRYFGHYLSRLYQTPQPAGPVRMFPESRSSSLAVLSMDNISERKADMFIPPVYADLDFELLVKELAVLQEVLRADLRRNYRFHRSRTGTVPGVSLAYIESGMVIGFYGRRRGLG